MTQEAGLLLNSIERHVGSEMGEPMCVPPFKQKITVCFVKGGSGPRGEGKGNQPTGRPLSLTLPVPEENEQKEMSSFRGRPHSDGQACQAVRRDRRDFKGF